MYSLNAQDERDGSDDSELEKENRDTVTYDFAS